MYGGNVNGKEKGINTSISTIIDKIKKYGYDGKQLHHIIRMNNFIFAYGEGKPYEECLKYLPNKEEMMKAKLNQYSLDDALQMAEDFDIDTKNLKDKYLKPQDEINKEALDLLNKIQYNVIKRKLKEDIKKEEN